MSFVYERPEGKISLPDREDPQKGCLFDFVNLVLSVEGKHAESWGIQAHQLAHLLGVCLRATLIPDEGRFPRLTIVVGERRADRVLVSLPDSEVSAEVLAGIAPIVPQRPFGLEIRLDSGRLVMAAIVRLQTRPDAFPYPVGRWPGLFINLAGPGRLLVQAVHFEYQVRYDEFWVEENLTTPLFGLTTKLHKAILSRLGSSRTLTDQEDFNLDQILIYVWDYLLGQVRAADHGGAFVILPDDKIDQELIRISHPTSLDLGQLLFERATGVLKSADLHDRCAALTGLSAVDGCVVFDSSLKVLGFGGRILAPASGNDLPPEVQRRGTRHQSAYWLCAKKPGCVMLVVSQDGGISVFRGDPGGVRYFRVGLNSERHGGLPL